jgi:hypothetical protein
MPRPPSQSFSTRRCGTSATRPAGSTRSQRRIARERLASPAIIVIGDVVRAAAHLREVDSRAAAGASRAA